MHFTTRPVLVATTDRSLSKQLAATLLPLEERNAALRFSGGCKASKTGWQILNVAILVDHF